MKKEKLQFFHVERQLDQLSTWFGLEKAASFQQLNLDHSVALRASVLAADCPNIPRGESWKLESFSQVLISMLRRNQNLLEENSSFYLLLVRT